MALTDSIEHKLDRGLADVRRTSRRIARTTRTAADDVGDLRTLLAELEDMLKHDADGDVATLRKRIQARLDDARSTLNHGSQLAADRMRESAERVSQVVHDNPWQAAGVVAGLAFAAGLLFARR